jgi:hypothetical protein
MNRAFQLIVAAILLVSLLFWGAVWWTGHDDLFMRRTGEGIPGSVGRAAATVSSSAGAPIAAPPASSGVGGPRGRVTDADERPAPRLEVPAPVEYAPVFVDQPKPPEPALPPEPPPVKANDKGEIDLSADPSTKAFTDFLDAGRAKRLELDQQMRGVPR